MVAQIPGFYAQPSGGGALQVLVSLRVVAQFPGGRGALHVVDSLVFIEWPWSRKSPGGHLQSGGRGALQILFFFMTVVAQMPASTACGVERLRIYFCKIVPLVKSRSEFMTDVPKRLLAPNGMVPRFRKW